MTEELHSLENELKELEKKIHATARTHRAEAKVFGEARAKYELASATALLHIYDFESSSGDKNTESVRKAKALKQCENEYMTYRIAETNAESSKEVLRALVSELSSIQTRSRLLMSEASLVSGNYK